MWYVMVMMVIMTAIGPTLVAHQGFQSFLTLFRRQLVQLQATSTVCQLVCKALAAECQDSFAAKQHKQRRQCRQYASFQTCDKTSLSRVM